MNFKKIPKDYFITILDRLSRFEPACDRYKRVFDDIINKFSLDYKLKSLTLEEEINLVKEIFNSSCSQSGDFIDNNSDFINLLFEIENNYFKQNKLSYQYLSTRLNYFQMLSDVEITEETPQNVIWLKNIALNHLRDVYDLRNKSSLLYPIQKIILCEGQTEELLLEPIFRLFGIDFNKEGIKVIAAGGKNQVARKYYKMIEYTKLPFFILLDKDAIQIRELIKPKLRKIDTLYLIKSGEFEDLIPQIMLQKTINYIHKNEYNCIFDDFEIENTMVQNLENIYKKYGFGEFKKAEFAKELTHYIKLNSTKEDFINSEINEITETFRLNHSINIFTSK